MFELKNPLVEYTLAKEIKICANLDCEGNQACLCSLCMCCSVCTSKCDCPQAQLDPNQKLLELLGLGDDMYRYRIQLLHFSTHIEKNHEARIWK